MCATWLELPGVLLGIQSCGQLQPRNWGYEIPAAGDLKNRLTITKAVHSPCTESKNCNILLISLKDPKLEDQRLYRVGAWISGTDPLGKFFLEVKPKNETNKKK